MKLHVAVCAFLFIINCYDALGLPSILLPGSFKGSTLTRQITNGVAAILALWLFYVATNEFSILIAKGHAALCIVKAITKKLIVYDTEGEGRGVTA